MASLEKLLKEEGFKGSKLKSTSRASLGNKAVSMPLDLYREQNPVISNVRIKTKRTRSNVSRLESRSDLQRSERIRSWQSTADVLEIESLDVESKNDVQEIESIGGRDSYDEREKREVQC